MGLMGLQKGVKILRCGFKEWSNSIKTLSGQDASYLQDCLRIYPSEGFALSRSALTGT